MVERLEDLQWLFLRHLRTEGKSPATLRLYGQSVTYLSSWLVAQGREADLDELSRPAIWEWLGQLAETREPGTVGTRYRGLRRFCGWFVEEGELTKNPMQTLSPPSVGMKPIPVLDDAELAALIKACAGRGLRDRRDEALIRLLLECGSRISEVCGLGTDQLDVDQGMAIVRGKGDKIRAVYFGARTARALDRYL